jgi:hypothetical protein
MTTAPDFGGREIEEGLLEDLGSPRQEHAVNHQDEAGSGVTTTRRTPRAWSAHGAARSSRPARMCGAGADGEWVHDICPVL